MANVIKHKRGSGSDPSASDLILGELAIRTDNGKLFTKMDNGSVAEIAGGGSDIAINTLSSSSATGGGSATFNGSAYRFTLSAPPSVSAQQLLVSINGVIQKPVAGTGQPSEGFSVDGTDIILGDAPATGSDFFILTFKSLGVSEPADNSVTRAKIVDGAILNADINASAAIAGSKISPIFTSATEVQNSTFKITDSNPEILLAVPSGGLDSRIINDGSGNLIIGHGVNSDTPTERLRLDSSGNVGIGETSPDTLLHIKSADNILATFESTDADSLIEFKDNGTSDTILMGALGGDDLLLRCDAGNIVFRLGNNSEKMRITSSGNVGIGTSVTRAGLAVAIGGNTVPSAGSTGGAAVFGNALGDAAYGLVCGATSSGHGYVQAQRTDGTASTYDLFLQPNGGNVGIGTSSPGAELHVEAATPEIRIKSTNASVSQGTEIGRLAIHTSDPTTPTGAGEVFKITSYSAQGNGADYGTKLINRAGSNSGESTISLGQGAVGAITFSTNTSGSGLERMRIDSSGDVLIGATTAVTDTKLVVAGNINQYNLDTGTGASTKSYVLGRSYTMSTSSTNLLTFDNWGTAAFDITVFRRDNASPAGAQVIKLYLAFHGSGTNITQVSIAQENKVLRGSIHNVDFGCSENNNTATLTVTGDDNGGETQDLTFYIMGRGNGNGTIVVV